MGWISNIKLWTDGGYEVARDIGNGNGLIEAMATYHRCHQKAAEVACPIYKSLNCSPLRWMRTVCGRRRLVHSYGSLALCNSKYNYH